ncbi:probable bifunctional methylthioribulose-1-phosphate dehydratase/enolase-phosphatase E1 2 [Punica granatum]|uniref:Probable bifunctional methylthioribulose-1-phosphate dehydratase/enolase-phosphatase E1 2 n=1 Tax=Punica granatum TaxID=22663 RepID=A0A6P8CEI1_PUNGR|nr:probable bifunctional methylthioribulose-1-phosphate dehydratase/enolase-phosphatase E1 2 [Punica granatum]XP_031379887.1 probable bifunctional methylthioribulose-1-phosphate dehydratase/enolase-phosphatase E1 2 [Punica granatum]
MAHQKTTAVLVRNHGVYIWGKSWVSAKTQAESYHYLFDATFKLHQLGLGWSTPKHSRFTEALFVDHDMLEYSRHFLLLHLEGITFDDLPEALRKWHASGSKVYTYSSCRREAHRAIMGKYNSYGDLTKYFCGYYVAASSYSEILLTVGVDKPSDMLFVTNSLLEAADARAAGMEVIMIGQQESRDQLRKAHAFRTVGSLLEI